MIRFILMLFCLSAFGAPTYDILIKGGKVVDGSGSPAFFADVAVFGDKIVSIGKLKSAKAKKVIDAKGLVIAPGFIDMMGQSEWNLLVDARAMSKVMMGVTTEITGEGESIAPLNPRILKEMNDFISRYNLKVDWTDLTSYFRRFEKQGAGVNLGTYVGAATVREMIVGYDDREPTAAELGKMEALVEEGMKQGALGISTALQYVPSRFAKTEELIELAKVARKYGGIYATHQRSEANAIDASLDEIFEIAKKAEIPAEIFHLKTSYQKNWGRMGEILKKIDAARASGLTITADVYPYTAACTGLSASLPPWVLEGGADKMVERLKDQKVRERLKGEIPKDTKEWENIYLGSGGADGVLISSTINKDLSNIQGKRISEIATEQKKEPLDALFDLLIADHGQTEAIYFCMNEQDLKQAMKAKYVSFCTDSSARGADGPLSDAKSHPRGWGAYPKVLAQYVRDEKWLTLEEAINKMTGLPASHVGLKNRGLLKEGYFADITVFNPKTVKPRATFASPHQYPEGIEFVVVNGQIEVDKGARTPVLSGRVLRGPGFKEVVGR